MPQMEEQQNQNNKIRKQYPYMRQVMVHLILSILFSSNYTILSIYFIFLITLF